MIPANLTATKFLRVLLVVFVLANALIPAFLVHAHSLGTDDVAETREEKSGYRNILSKYLFQTPFCPESGDLVITNEAICSLAAGSYIFDSVTIESGGTLILNSDTTNGFGVTISTPTMIINGAIITNGQGYPSASGPGKGTTGGAGSGAGHGGMGGDSSDGYAGGDGYGDLYAPTALGSGGGNQGIALGGYGGGAVKLMVDGTLEVNGTISANGTNGNKAGPLAGSAAGGGGSGGSIWIIAGGMSGNGVVQANGGSGIRVNTGYSGGGAGGRIALDVPASANTYTGTVSTFGGTGHQNAGAGTIYWASANKLVIDNNSRVGRGAILLSADYNFSEIDIRSSGVLRVSGSASNLTLTNNTMSGDGTGRLEVEGMVHAPTSFTITGIMLAIYNTLDGPTNILTQINGGLELHASAMPLGIYNYNNIIVGTGTTLRLVSFNNGDTDYTNDYGVTLQADSLTIETGGMVEADRQGYPSASGPGKGTTGGAGSGAGHGGMGGDSSDGYAGGDGYGDLYAPTALGSGGGNQGIALGGYGGGAVKLMVDGTLEVNGTISANGTNGNKAGPLAGSAAGGGGSGGSIWIIAGGMSGNGVVQANGGSGISVNTGYSGGGAGGRIALDVPASANTYTGTVSTFGGTGHQAGDTGTIYLGVVDPAQSIFTIEPVEIIVSLEESATASVTLKNEKGIPIPNRLVELAVISGAGLRINNTYALVNEYIPIGVTDANGVVTAALTTIQTGVRTIKARTGQIPLSQATVTFVAGPVSAINSLVYASPSNAIADGQMPINVVVTALDEFGNPIPSAEVEIFATGSAIVTQPSSPTSVQGKATGSIVNSVIEMVTISASVNGTPLSQTQGVIFRGADMTLSMSGPSILTAGADIQYQVVVNNKNGLPIENAVLQVILPDFVTYLNNTLSAPTTQNGSMLTWDLGDLAGGAKVAFNITGRASSALNVGDILAAQGEVSSTTSEESYVNNSATVNTLIVDGHSFTTSILPLSANVSANARVEYSILVENTGLLADQYAISVSGLDEGWYTLSAASLNLAPGGQTYVNLSIQTEGCVATGSIPFSVTVAGAQSNEVKSAQVNFQSAPVLSEVYPDDGTVTGSTSVAFSWRSDTEAGGVLKLYPVGQPDQIRTYQGDAAHNHSIVVDGLDRDTTYEWYVEAASECGVTTTTPRQITIQKGIVFSSHELTHTIDRDYNQIKYVSIKNLDSVPRTVGLEIDDVYEDLIVNFGGTGSFEEVVTLLPGETRQVKLIYFAQDAMLEKYDITAKLTSTNGEQTITDFAVIHVNVPFTEVDYDIEEIGMHPTLHVMQYRVINRGAPLTDLNVSAVDPVTGLPAPVILIPQITHARLGRGESVTFVAVPQYGPEHISGVNPFSSSVGVFASPSRQFGAGVFNIIAAVNGNRKTVTHPSVAQCDKQIFAVHFDGPMAYTTPIRSWYCPNKPSILLEILLNAGLWLDNITGGQVQLTLTPSSATVDHTVNVSLNGYGLGAISASIPNGSYSFNFGSEAINKGIGVNPIQRLAIDTQWPYPDKDIHHYQIGTGGNITVAMNGLTVFVCADSLEEARQNAMDLFNIHPLPTVVNLQIEIPNPGTIVSLDENGFINVKAFVGDDRDTYYNDYTVQAEVTYMGHPDTPTDTFALFDDGKIGHKDVQKNDRYFNALWKPRFEGEVKLKITAVAPGGLADTEERTFYVEALPDFEVAQVFIEKITRENQAVEVQAEIVNNGFSAAGPVTVVFNYYATNIQGEKVGAPIHTTTFTLFNTIFDPTFDHGEVAGIRDNSFIAPEAKIYYVEVIVDP